MREKAAQLRRRFSRCTSDGDFNIFRCAGYPVWNGYASAWYYGGIDRELAAAGKIVTLVYFFFALPGALSNGVRFIQTCRIDADHNRDAAPFQKSSAGMKQRYKKPAWFKAFTTLL